MTKFRPEPWIRDRGRWKKLGMCLPDRLDLLKNLATQVLRYERALTTLPRAYAVASVLNKLVELGKNGTRQAWLIAHDVVRCDAELHKLFTELPLRYRDRKHCYTRVLKAGFRKDDHAQMGFVELIDHEGELRPARPPKVISPLLPPALQEYLREHYKPGTISADEITLPRAGSMPPIYGDVDKRG